MSNSRIDENGSKYTTVHARSDVEGLTWDSEFLNWTLFEMAVRLGKVNRTSDDSGAYDAVPGELADEFFKEFDRLEAVATDTQL